MKNHRYKSQISNGVNLVSKHSCATCFTTLSDKTRVRIIKELQGQALNVATLTGDMGVTQPTVSHHLKLLEEHGFVVKEKKGRETFYQFNKEYPCKGCGVFSAPIRI